MAENALQGWPGGCNANHPVEPVFRVNRHFVREAPFMRFLAGTVLLLFVLGFIGSTGGQQKPAKDPNIADTPPLAAAEQQKLFHLPKGFVIELVAADPQINKP